MADIVLNHMTNGQNISVANTNFDVLQDNINNHSLQKDGGNNVLFQDLDLNGHSLLNLKTNPSNPGSALSVSDGDARYYQQHNVPIPSVAADAVNKGYIDALNLPQGAFTQAGTGAVTRTWTDKVRENCVTPEDFGALGNGSTDDTVAFTNALATGKDLILGDGKIYIIGPIVLGSTQKIFGQGIWKTQLKAKSNCPTGYLVSLSSVNVYAAGVFGLTINCNAPAQTNTVSGIGFDNTGGVGFPFGDPKHTIADCYVVNSNGTGFLIGNLARGSTLRSLYANQCAVAGYEISTTDSFIEDCVAGACGVGINSHGANNRHIGLKAFGSTINGILVNGQRDTFIGCEAQDNAGAGYTLTNGDRDLTLVGCLADSNQTYGFNVQSAIGAKIIGSRSITRGGGAYTQTSGFNFGAASACYIQAKVTGNTSAVTGSSINNTTILDTGSGQDFKTDSNISAQQGETTEVFIGSLSGAASVRLGGDMTLSRVSSSVARINGALQINTFSNIRSGTGVPSSGVGSNGDVYIRSDGAAGSFIYGKVAGAWIVLS